MVKFILKEIAAGKARFLCAIIGIALAVGALVFTTSLIATNRAQAPAIALKASQPWRAWHLDGIRVGFRRRMPPPDVGATKGPRPPRREEPPVHVYTPPADLEMAVVQTTIDYRPGGHVLQGPPMMALIAAAPTQNPYGAVALTSGRWVDEKSHEMEVVCVRKSMRRFGMAAPALGESLKFVGEHGTMTAKIVGYLDGDKLPREFPYVFANANAFSALAKERHGKFSLYATAPNCPAVLTPQSESVIQSFKGDEQKRMDYATPLLLVAAFLTALSLLINTLLLSVEAQRATLAKLRIIGMTRMGVVRIITGEALLAAFAGWLIGTLAAIGGLSIFVQLDTASFPTGMTLDLPRILLTLGILPILVTLAVLAALRPALKVRPMDAILRRPVSRTRGMAITFACGFAAFVAVEVWGASLMRAFVPSPEWPDAIVSLLPSGLAEPDMQALNKITGVQRMCELSPLQLPMAADARHNALFLAAAWLPKFNFIEGDWSSAEQAIRESNGVVITEMMSNAYHLHRGDQLAIMVGRGSRAKEERLPIVGVVDLNWHMVTSRGLVRGLNGAPGMTDGPVFCSYETMDEIDLRPFHGNVTHLWVEYDPAFLAAKGTFPAGREIEAAITKVLGNPVECTVRLHARDEIADGTLAHGSDIIGQTARVPFLFLFILAIGFVAMLVAEADVRKQAFRTLRAIGATRGQIARLLTLTAIKTALIGILFGVPIGSLVGWLFTLKTGSIWPGLPHWFVLPVEIVAEGAIGALLFALIFAIPTAITLVTGRRS